MIAIQVYNAIHDPFLVCPMSYIVKRQVTIICAVVAAKMCPIALMLFKPRSVPSWIIPPLASAITGSPRRFVRRSVAPYSALGRLAEVATEALAILMEGSHEPLPYWQ